jgi:type I restriction enzyme S subunit
MTFFRGPIKDVCEGIYDGPHATPKEATNGPIFLGIKNVTEDGRLDLSEIRHVSEGEFPKWTKRVKPQKDDIVFSYEATLHRYAKIPENFHGCLGRRMALVRVDQSKVSPTFLHYYFLSPAWKAQINANIITGATVNRIPLSRFPEFTVQLPNLNAQHRVAEILANHDVLIENNIRRIQLLEESARLLYREWFVHLRFPGHEHLEVRDGVPQGWSRESLEAICIPKDGIQTGPFGSQLHQSDYTDDGIPVVMPKDIATRRVSLQSIARIPESLANQLRRHRMQIGDTVYGRRGDIGRRAFIGPRQDGYFCGTGCLRFRPDPAIVNPRYLFDQLGAPDTEGCIINRAKGSTMPNLSAGALKTVPILLPPKRIQDSYAEAVEPTNRLIETLAEQNQKLAQARDILLPRLMNGELAV